MLEIFFIPTTLAVSVRCSNWEGGSKCDIYLSILLTHSDLEKYIPIITRL